MSGRLRGSPAIAGPNASVDAGGPLAGMKLSELVAPGAMVNDEAMRMSRKSTSRASSVC
ncbi:hypothetical protein D3C78_1903930 [compost metagenome]